MKAEKSGSSKIKGEAEPMATRFSKPENLEETNMKTSNLKRQNTFPNSTHLGSDNLVEVLPSLLSKEVQLTRIKDESEDIILLEPVSESNDNRPHKRLRLIPEVVLFTWADLQERKKVDFKKIKKMENPKVKKIKNMDLLVDTVHDRLKVIGLDRYPITLDRDVQEFWVSRDFMSTTYGGNMQKTCPSIDKKRLAQHGFDNFTYLNPEYQPWAPQWPGKPGLFFCTSSGNDWPGLQRVFTRIQSAQWQYMGQYVIKTCASLTKEEWAEQKPEFRKTWSREICRQGWGFGVRVRVCARKVYGCKAAKQEFQEIVDNKRYKETTPEEVDAAYKKGEERLGVWTMECVGYDTAFQLQLYEKFPKWVQPPRRTRNSGADNSRKKSTKANAPATGKTVTRGRKRKRPEPEGSESESPDPEGDDSDNQDIRDATGQELIVYQTKGTRSRPIHL